MRRLKCFLWLLERGAVTSVAARSFRIATPVGDHTNLFKEANVLNADC